MWLQEIFSKLAEKINSSSRLGFLILVSLTTALAATVYFLSRPGFMYHDSFAIFAIARGDFSDDWVPPAAGFIWRAILKIWNDPEAILAFQIISFYLVVLLYSRLMFERLRTQIIFMVAVGAHPFVFVYLIMLTKESLLATLMFAAATLYWASLKYNRAILTALTVLALLLCTLIRWEAIIAVIPFSLLLFQNLLPARKWAARVLITLVFAIAPIAFNHFTTDSASHPERQIYVIDLADVSAIASEVLFSEIPADQHQEALKFLSNDYLLGDIISLRQGGFFDSYKIRIGAEHHFKDWVNAIKKHPYAYLKSRWISFRRLEAFNTVRACFPFYRGVAPNDFGIRAPVREAYSYTKYFFEITESSFLFRAWAFFWFALVATLYMRAFDQRRKKFYLVVLSSAIVYQGAYFFIATTCSPRLIYWSIFAQWLVLISTVALILEQRATKTQAIN